MGLIKSLTSSISGTFADQWKDIITADDFGKHDVVVPGQLKSKKLGKGSNLYGTEGVISNGSKIFVPENTVAFIFSQSGIENVITTPGGYEYLEGEDSVFNGDGIKKSLFKQTVDRFSYGGITPTEKEIAYVNLREIRDIQFGTRGPQVYNDIHYGCDLEIYAYGSFSIKIVDPEKFIRNFVPANVKSYSFKSKSVKAQVSSDFIQSFIVALNTMSSQYRISQLPSKANEISNTIKNDSFNAGTWVDRFGFDIVQVTIENIEFSTESRELVNQYNTNKMKLKAYDDTSQQASNISAQQKIASGIESHGLGDVGGMVFGTNLAQGISPGGELKSAKSELSLDEQIEALKKLKELVDIGLLSQEEFEIKKKELMGF